MFKKIYSFIVVIMLFPPYALVLAQTESLAEQARSRAATASTLEELRSFSDALDAIRQHYVDPIDDQALLHAAIAGMANVMDQHSGWLPARRFSDVATDAAGSFGGIGVSVIIEAGFITITDTLPDSPATEADIHSGDRIIAIDGQSLQGQNLRAAIDTLSGSVDSHVNLRLRRGDQIIDKRVTRTRLDIPAVTASYLDDRILLLSIDQFSQTASRQFSQQLQTWLENTPEPTGVILDLRDNPGGTVEAAVAIADTLLTDGLIVSAVGRSEDASFSFTASQNILTALPATVLINNSTASASEILAGALQDHERAVVIGQRSYGKGSVQNIIPLPNGSGLRLTTARYKTPAGRSIDGLGITPDIVLSAKQTAGVDAVDTAIETLLDAAGQ